MMMLSTWVERVMVYDESVGQLMNSQMEYTHYDFKNLD